MKKMILSLILSTVLLLSSAAWAEHETVKPLSALCDAAFDLLFNTGNVTLSGQAVFSLDGERFKTATWKYVQDGDRSFWDLRLSAPKPDGKERENGYTIIADGPKVYVMEVYHPREYKTGTTRPQTTILRESVEMDLMKELLRAAIAAAENASPEESISITEDMDSQTVNIEIRENVPPLMNIALNIFRQYAARRYFSMDYDQVSRNQMAAMDSYITVTEAILACTQSAAFRYAEIAAAADPDGFLRKISGTAGISLDTGRDGTRLLDISFYLDITERGTSHVDSFSPKVYDVKLAEGAMDIESIEYSELDTKTEEKLKSLAVNAWTQAGYQLNEPLYSNSYRQNGKFFTELTDSSGSLRLNCYTNAEGSVLELRNPENAWQENTFLYEEPYPDAELTEEAALRVLEYLSKANPEARSRISRLKLQCWFEEGKDLYLEFCEDPIAQDWDGVLIVVKVKPEWQLMYYSCFSNG